MLFRPVAFINLLEQVNLGALVHENITVHILISSFCLHSWFIFCPGFISNSFFLYIKL